MTVVVEKKTPFVYILILNWNGLHDTIECLESVFRSDYPHYKVIVCDNNSSDGSLNMLMMWADGIFDFCTPENSPLKDSLSLNIRKPIPYKSYNRQEAESGECRRANERLIFIQNGNNLGFAGGCNVGIRYALALGDFEYIWLLNNDTVVQQDALKLMVNRMEVAEKTGMCGSTLLYYNEPNIIQALGGASFNKWLGVSTPIGISQNRETIDYNDDYNIDHLIGASMLVAKPFLEDIGLMSEEYFLYYEEIDWSIRGRRLYNLTYEPKSIVFHKEGRSIGSSNKPMERSELSDYYGLRNRIVFTRKFFPLALPIVYFGLIIAMLNRIYRLQWKRVTMIVKILLS